MGYSFVESEHAARNIAIVRTVIMPLLHALKQRCFLLDSASRAAAIIHAADGAST